MKKVKIPPPTHVYIGREPCGCCTTVISDLPGCEKHTADQVYRTMRRGCTIERVTWSDYRERVSQEPGFMNCQCNPRPVQVSFLGALV